MIQFGIQDKCVIDIKVEEVAIELICFDDKTIFLTKRFVPLRLFSIEDILKDLFDITSSIVVEPIILVV